MTAASRPVTVAWGEDLTFRPRPPATRLFCRKVRGPAAILPMPIRRRARRFAKMVSCAGHAKAASWPRLALFYPNGRIESCVLDNSGTQGVALTDDSGKVMNCAARSVARFDPEGRALSCSPF
jgi:hypothetical protein